MIKLSHTFFHCVTYGWKKNNRTEIIPFFTHEPWRPLGLPGPQFENNCFKLWFHLKCMSSIKVKWSDITQSKILIQINVTFFPINHLVTPQIHAVIVWGGTDPQAGNHWTKLYKVINLLLTHSCIRINNTTMQYTVINQSQGSLFCSVSLLTFLHWLRQCVFAFK